MPDAFKVIQNIIGWRRFQDGGVLRKDPAFAPFRGHPFGILYHRHNLSPIGHQNRSLGRTSDNPSGVGVKFFESNCPPFPHR